MQQLIIALCYLFQNVSAIAVTNSASDRNLLSKIPIVICPGFGNDQIDYLDPLDQGDKYGFVSVLSRRGFDPDLIKVLPLKRYEWLRVAGGLFDPNFYTGKCRPKGLGYEWYVQRLHNTIEEGYAEVGWEQWVLMISHLAGGWLTMAALEDGSWDFDCGASNNYGRADADVRWVRSTNHQLERQHRRVSHVGPCRTWICRIMVPSCQRRGFRMYLSEVMLSWGGNSKQS